MKMNKFRSQLRDTRQAAGMSQTELGGRAGVGGFVVMAWKLAARAPPQQQTANAIRSYNRTDPDAG